MELFHHRAAGLDLHKEMIAACVRIDRNGKAEREHRQFETTTAGLEALRTWLVGQGCTIVAMEATGVYWMAAWRILKEADFELLLANAAHIKAVPGRKTDQNDAAWIADLAAHGLIRGSHVLDNATQELRSFTRTRKQFVHEQTRHGQRIQKTLTEANIKLDSILSDIMGASGRRVLEAIVCGETNAARLAALIGAGVKASRAAQQQALHGALGAHHRLLIGQHLKLWDGLAQAIAAIDAEIDARLQQFDQDKPSFRGLIGRLVKMPGVSGTAAAAIVAEIGTDLSGFQTAGHCVAWAGLCPGQNESAGKRKPTKLRKGDKWLKSMLVQCAWAAKRCRDSYFSAQYERIKARRGGQKAICAVAAAMLTTIYHIIKDGTTYQDLGADYFAKRHRTSTAARLIGRLKHLGYDVAIQSQPQAA